MNGFGRNEPCGDFRRLSGTLCFRKASGTSDDRGIGFSARIHQLPEDRKQLIFRIRRQIAENAYDTPQKLEIAMERLFDTLSDDSESI